MCLEHIELDPVILVYGKYYKEKKIKIHMIHMLLRSECLMLFIYVDSLANLGIIYFGTVGEDPTYGIDKSFMLYKWT